MIEIKYYSPFFKSTIKDQIEITAFLFTYTYTLIITYMKQNSRSRFCQ